MGVVVVVLGSTGSIGTNTLDICKKYKIGIEAISCNSKVEILNQQIQEFNPKYVCINDEKQAKNVKHTNVFVGENGMMQMLSMCKSDTVVNALVGFAGLKPSLKTQELGKKLALANKESLVVGGKFIKKQNLDAIDSEHFGLKFLLQNKTKVKKLIITASGGAFYKTAIKALKDVTPNDALKHPNWNMGAKITIDSASMANKLFEIMEAYWLYGISDIDAIIEPTSVIHALVEFIDGSTTAHISRPDMRLAIAHAILKNVDSKITPHENLIRLKALKFHTISHKKYPIFAIKDMLLSNPDLGVVVNAANEVAVYAFLERKCNFLDIQKIVLNRAKIHKNIAISSQDELFIVDNQIRKESKKLLGLI